MLTVEEAVQAQRLVMAWRCEPHAAVECLRCSTPGLAIVDQSARPHAEWYELSCPTCGLKEVLHIPLAAPIGE